MAVKHIPRTDCPAGCNWTFITKAGMNNHLKTKHVCKSCGGVGSGKPSYEEFPVVWRTCDDCHGLGWAP